MQIFDAVVVGAGPAGLSAAGELSRRGLVLLIEQGGPTSFRRREVPEEVLSGVGGAGLFSDGKHSFFPSAQALWTLPDREALALAFSQTAALLRRHGVEAGPLPASTTTTKPSAGTWHEKRYPALYAPFDRRLRCIEELLAQAQETWTKARIVGARREGCLINVDIDRQGRQEQVSTRAVVVATGRWSPRWIRPWLEELGAAYAFGRVEFGVRLETAASAELFALLPGVDGKLRFVDDDGTEFRTFCTCRQGRVLLGRAGGLAAFSGHADGPPSGRSSVGLLVRSTSSSLGSELDRLLPAAVPRTLPLQAWRSGGAPHLASVFGEQGAGLLWRALQHLLAWAPALADDDDVLVHVPCIEGVGAYPVDDGSLQVAPGVWVVGDACGRFRGIVASMISGRYAAARLGRAEDA